MVARGTAQHVAVALWGLDLVEDPYSMAKSGEVILTGADAPRDQDSSQSRFPEGRATKRLTAANEFSGLRVGSHSLGACSPLITGPGAVS